MDLEDVLRWAGLTNHRPTRFEFAVFLEKYGLFLELRNTEHYRIEDLAEKREMLGEFLQSGGNVEDAPVALGFSLQHLNRVATNNRLSSVWLWDTAEWFEWLALARDQRPGRRLARQFGISPELCQSLHSLSFGTPPRQRRRRTREDNGGDHISADG